MAVSQYGIDVFNFEFWRGPPPTRVQQHGRVFTRPGADGIALQDNGNYGQPFETELVAWFATFAEADAALALYTALPFSGALALKWAGLNYTGLYGLAYHALHVEPLGVKMRPLLRRAGVGGVTFSPGAENRSRWLLVPELIT